jgi:hypothetical protein
MFDGWRFDVIRKRPQRRRPPLISGTGPHAVNTPGTFLVSQWPLPTIKETGWGGIVNSASIAGKRAACYSSAA